MKRFGQALFLAATLAVSLTCRAARATLDIYFIDVEGGQSTLIVTPAGQTFLIDTGFPGNGGFQAKAGDPKQARDANRIVAAARDAGVDHIDYLLITHFHADHVGGVVELSQLLPIDTFIDHGSVLPEAETNVQGTLEVFKAYEAVRAQGTHIEPRPGDHLPLKGIDAIVVSSARATIAKPLSGAGEMNASCTAARDAQDPNENPRSTGIRLQFGKFRFLDLGDLTGPPLHSLACPKNLIGPVDVYLVAHHGGPDAADPAIFAAFKPRIAILNNGTTKGGALEMFKTLQQLKLEDVWQLHRSTAAASLNFSGDRIANLDESSAYWIKLSAKVDGSFAIVNGRSGEQVKYHAR
ncbi:MAG TPA: MBL fold metallo-hydrolase [Steroidobacteraceae bacterium]|nr:MBL fold metallo-hydrolase [Steroidobacteraceae bacterium]